MSTESEKNNKMSFEEIEKECLEEISAAEEFSKKLANKRMANWDRYYGEKLGNEVKGRSQFITKELMDTIEWMMPYFMRQFCAGDPKIDLTIEGQETWVGKALMDKILLDLGNADTDSHFLVFYQWFKESLVTGTSYVKTGWDFEQEKEKASYSNMSRDQVLELSQIPNIEVTSAVADPERDGLSFKKVEIETTLTKKDEISVTNVPSWDFLVDSKSKGIGDTYGKGQKTEVTIDYLRKVDRSQGSGFFKNLEGLEDHSSESVSLDNAERISYMREQEETDLVTKKEGAKTLVTLVEWYTQMDINKDGFLVDVVCFVGNNKLLRWEKNEDGILFSFLKPIIDCYKFAGTPYADLLVDIQNLKTMLFRRILDNFDYQNSGRYLASPNANIDKKAFLQNIPGDVITGEPGKIENITPPPFNPSSLSVLDFVDQMKENRTGITKYNQGSDSGGLNKTATGIIQIQNAAMQRLELIARIFAETGIKDIYKKIARQYQQNLKEPFFGKVLGVERKITPDMLQGKVTATVNLGVAASVGAEEAAKIEHMLGVLFNINAQFPGLLQQDKIHNLTKRYILALGFKQVDDFIVDVNAYTQQAQQAQQSQAQLRQKQEQVLDLQMQLEQMKVQIQQMEAKTKQQKVMFDYETDKLGIDQDMQEALVEVDQKDKDSKRKHKVDLLRHILDRGKKA